MLHESQGSDLHLYTSILTCNRSSTVTVYITLEGLLDCYFWTQGQQLIKQVKLSVFQFVWNRKPCRPTDKISLLHGSLWYTDLHTPTFMLVLHLYAGVQFIYIHDIWAKWAVEAVSVKSSCLLARSRYWQVNKGLFFIYDSSYKNCSSWKVRIIAGTLAGPWMRTLYACNSQTGVCVRLHYWTWISLISTDVIEME